MRYLLGDKGYDADRLRRALRENGTTPVIPGRRNRKRAIRYDRQRYKDRHLIENAFCRIKHVLSLPKGTFAASRPAMIRSPPTSCQAWPSPQPSHSGFERVWTLGSGPVKLLA